MAFLEQPTPAVYGNALDGIDYDRIQCAIVFKHVAQDKADYLITHANKVGDLLRLWCARPQAIIRGFFPRSHSKKVR